MSGSQGMCSGCLYALGTAKSEQDVRPHLSGGKETADCPCVIMYSSAAPSSVIQPLKGTT